MDLQVIINLNTNEETKEAVTQYGSNANQIAVAQILQSFYYQHITDRWGDIPYSESLLILDGIRQPDFDTQESVYSSVMATLKQAVSNIEDANPVTGDIMFGGDMDMWRKFGNTILMNMALRMSEANPTLAETEFNAAVTAGVFESDVFYQHLALEAYDNPWEDRFLTRRDYCVALPLVEKMQTVANGGMLDVSMDPRLPVYADPAENGGEYVGMPFGLSEAEAGAISNSDVSFLGESLRQQESVTYIYTQAQILFARAEAAFRGWTSDDPQTLYEEAITASMAQYGVDMGDYMNNSVVQYDGTLEQIMTQKWIANYLNGYEAWADWRRTGYPQLDPPENALNESGEIPVRQGYPTFERDLNSENYAKVEAVDGLDAPVWWDK
jgi:hypothetical protein